MIYYAHLCPKISEMRVRNCQVVKCMWGAVPTWVRVGWPGRQAGQASLRWRGAEKLGGWPPWPVFHEEKVSAALKDSLSSSPKMKPRNHTRIVLPAPTIPVLPTCCASRRARSGPDLLTRSAPWSEPPGSRRGGGVRAAVHEAFGPRGPGTAANPSGSRVETPARRGRPREPHSHSAQALPIPGRAGVVAAPARVSPAGAGLEGGTKGAGGRDPHRDAGGCRSYRRAGGALQTESSERRVRTRGQAARMPVRGDRGFVPRRELSGWVRVSWGAGLPEARAWGARGGLCCSAGERC